MSERSGQNLQNHIMIEPKGIICALLAVITVILGAVGCFNGSSTVIALGVLFSGLTLFMVFFTARTYGVKLQDRIIRTEMCLRLRDVLDGDLAARAESLSIPQLIGLRFASDGEMAELVTKVLDENITDRKEIKKLVKDWQGDYDRI